MSTDAEGLAVLARKAKATGMITGNMHKKLVHLEQAMKWSQHASTPKAHGFMRELQTMVGCSSVQPTVAESGITVNEGSTPLVPISTPVMSSSGSVTEIDTLVPDNLDCWYFDVPPPPAPPALDESLALKCSNLENFRAQLYSSSWTPLPTTGISCDPNDFYFHLGSEDLESTPANGSRPRQGDIADLIELLKSDEVAKSASFCCPSIDHGHATNEVASQTSAVVVADSVPAVPKFVQTDAMVVALDCPRHVVEAASQTFDTGIPLAAKVSLLDGDIGKLSKQVQKLRWFKDHVCRSQAVLLQLMGLETVLSNEDLYMPAAELYRLIECGHDI